MSFWESIKPATVTFVVYGLYPALTALIAWYVTQKTGKKLVQDEKLLSAVRETEATKSDRVPLTQWQALQLAIQIAIERGIKMPREELAAELEAKNEAEKERRESVPPQQ